MKKLFKKLKSFDKITKSTLTLGCPAVETEATIRYGLVWREVYLKARLETRSNVFKLQNKLFPYTENP